MPDEFGPEVYSVATAARAIGERPETLREAIQRGDLDAQRVGRRWRILRDDLVKWLRWRARRAA